MPLLPQASYPPPGTAARSPLDQPLRQIVGLVNSSYGFFMEGGLGRSVQILWPGNYSSKMQRSFIMFSGQNLSQEFNPNIVYPQFVVC